MGRHPRAEHAAAALVAVAVLRDHRLGGRLLDRLSGVAAGFVLHATASFSWHARSAVASRSRRAAGAARADDGEARGGVAAGDRVDAGTARFRPRARRAAPSPTIARPATAPAAAAPRAIPISTTTTGCGAARSTDIAADDHPRRALRRRCRAIKARCRPSAATACSSATKSSTVANYVRSLSGLPTAPGADLARGAKIFADNCAVCHGDGRQGQPRGRRAQSDRSDLALRLRHGDHHRWRLERARRRDAGLGRQARSGDDQGACGLRPYVGRREK